LPELFESLALHFLKRLNRRLVFEVLSRSVSLRGLLLPAGTREEPLRRRLEVRSFDLSRHLLDVLDFGQQQVVAEVVLLVIDRFVVFEAFQVVFKVLQLDSYFSRHAAMTAVRVK